MYKIVTSQVDRVHSMVCVVNAQTQAVAWTYVYRHDKPGECSRAMNKARGWISKGGAR